MKSPSGTPPNDCHMNLLGPYGSIIIEWMWPKQRKGTRNKNCILCSHSFTVTMMFFGRKWCDRPVWMGHFILGHGQWWPCGSPVQTCNPVQTWNGPVWSDLNGAIAMNTSILKVQHISPILKQTLNQISLPIEYEWSALSSVAGISALFERIGARLAKVVLINV